MPRSAPDESAFTADRLEALNLAWHDYRERCRPIYLRAPGIEKRYLRTCDEAAYSRERSHLQYQIRGALRHWVAACRRILGRRVLVEPVGSSGCGAPQCFLVRVPKRDELALDERVFGKPEPGDALAWERIGLVQRDKEREAREEATRIVRSDLYDRMVQALADSRTHAAYKLQFKAARDATPRDTSRYAELTKLMYFHHARFARTHKRAVMYRNRLANAGLPYDLNAIATPLDVLPYEKALPNAQE